MSKTYEVTWSETTNYVVRLPADSPGAAKREFNRWIQTADHLRSGAFEVGHRINYDTGVKEVR